MSGECRLSEKQAIHRFFRIPERGGGVKTDTSEIHRNEVFAVGRMRRAARGARTTAGEAQQNVVARRDAGDIPADFLDDARSLMAENEWQLDGYDSVPARDVRMADAAGMHFYPNFICPDLVELKFFKDEWTMRLPQYRSLDLHGGPFQSAFSSQKRISSSCA
jgi:hypothetical protein